MWRVVPAEGCPKESLVRKFGVQGSVQGTKTERTKQNEE